MVTGLLLISVAGSAFSAADKPKKQKLTESEKFSYSMGINVAASLSQLGSDIDMKLFLQGLDFALTGKGKPLLSPEEARQVQVRFMKKRQAQMQQKMKASADINKKLGAEFLAENKSKKGVKTTASGLQYKVVIKGKGKKPKSTDRVKVHYRGKLINDREFDSSHARGKPTTFKANQVIAGWTEALQLMPVGSTYKLFIPSNLAYGARALPNSIIGANSTLIFDIELLEIL
ncbi:MAG: FKBP-type peptidyl-prolyl cis-trans isomerase [Gammaproteobacteria bacterium]|nr:FKBP-type peptidyl-prolyl cis-trans isomerase [Gammaproteobacteria bacterium]